jgi:hypothetical protein
MSRTRFRAAAQGFLRALVVAVPLLFAAPGAAQPPVGEIKEVLKVLDRLTPLDPEDAARKGCRYKVHACALTAGVQYTIDASGSPSIHPMLRVKDRAGKVLRENQERSPWRNSRVVLVPERTDSYDLVVTTQEPGERGKYFLLVRSSPVGWSSPSPLSWEMLAADVPLEVGDVAVRLKPLFTSQPGAMLPILHGYAEYRFTVRNASATESRRVKLTLPARGESAGRGGAPYLQRVTATVEVPPGAAREVALLQPPLPFSPYRDGRSVGAGQVAGTGTPSLIHSGEIRNTELGIEVDGRAEEDTLPLAVLQRADPMLREGQRLPGNDFFVNVLCGPGLVPQITANFFKAGVGVPHSLGVSRALWSGEYRGQRVNFDRTQNFLDAGRPGPGWSKDWLAYSGLDGIAVTGDQLDGAPADVRLALWRYVECGGALVVVGPCKTLPPSWGRRKAQFKGGTACYAGLGVCLTTDRRALAEWEPEQWQAVEAAWDKSSRPWQEVRTADQANRAFPVVDDVSVPVRGLFLAMVAFALAIGPLNLWLLARKNRKIWMLWTVPVFSLATCTAVVLYMFASEGWSGHVRAEGLTVLDEAEGRASTVGWIGFYAPLAPGDGLHFSRATELTPQLALPQNRYYRTHTPGRSLDWTADGQRLTSGWITARVPAHFLLRKSEDRTERLAVSKDGGGLTATNGLGAGIRELWLADAQGRVYRAGPVAAGAQAALLRQEGQAEGSPAALRLAYAGDWLDALKRLAAEPRGCLRPGCYVAVLEGSPFIEDGLRTYQSRKGGSVVFGILKEAPDAG